MIASSTQFNVLRDLAARGRVIERRIGDWGGMLEPLDIPGTLRGTPLGRVKTVTIDAMEKRGWIEQDAGVTFDSYYVQGRPKVYRITDAGLKVCGRSRDAIGRL